MKYELEFRNISEVRMGSPYNVADVCLKGPFVPDLTDFSFQDIGVISSDGHTACLVQWETSNNEPGFRIWKIDSNSEIISRSNMIKGCCTSLLLLNDNKIKTSFYTDQLNETILGSSDFHEFKIN